MGSLTFHPRGETHPCTPSFLLLWIFCEATRAARGLSVNIMPADDDRDDRIDTSRRRADDSDEDDLESIEPPPPKCFGKMASRGEYMTVSTNTFGPRDCCPPIIFYLKTPYGCLFILLQVSHCLPRAATSHHLCTHAHRCLAHPAVRRALDPRGRVHGTRALLRTRRRRCR